MLVAITIRSLAHSCLSKSHRKVVPAVLYLLGRRLPKKSAGFIFVS